MRIVFFGSGAFGLPTLDALAGDHDVALVVSQPARPAGRKRVPTPTPIGAWADAHDRPQITPERLDPASVTRILDVAADAHVVIAYGHKIPPSITDAAFSINLHASLLPRWRGASPINRAIMAGDEQAGVSVIALAEKMDAGVVYAQRAVAIGADETAGELHDRLAELGPEVIASVLAAHADGRASGDAQPADGVTLAPKLEKRDGTADPALTAHLFRRRVHGLIPWPGCTVRIDGESLKLWRVAAADAPEEAGDAPVGRVVPDGRVRCADGWIRLVDVQPPGGKRMPFEAYRRGRPIAPDSTVSPND